MNQLRSINFLVLQLPGRVKHAGVRCPSAELVCSITAGLFLSYYGPGRHVPSAVP
jgi:hypothetical protein